MLEEIYYLAHFLDLTCCFVAMIPEYLSQLPFHPTVFLGYIDRVPVYVLDTVPILISLL